MTKDEVNEINLPQRLGAQGHTGEFYLKNHFGRTGVFFQYSAIYQGNEPLHKKTKISKPQIPVKLQVRYIHSTDWTAEHQLFMWVSHIISTLTSSVTTLQPI